MVNLKKCQQECSIVAGLDPGMKAELLARCGRLCLGPTTGPIGPACGIPTITTEGAMAKNLLTSSALREARLVREMAHIIPMPQLEPAQAVAGVA